MEKLGINPVSLITQIINFSILVFILSKLVYKPVLKMLDERRKKIQEGLDLTAKLEEEKEKLSAERTKVLDQAKVEAKTIMEKARDQGKKIEADIIAQAQVKAEEVLKRGKKDLEIRQKELEKKLVGDTVEMSVALAQKLIGEILDEKNQQELLRKRVAHFLKDKKLFKE